MLHLSDTQAARHCQGFSRREFLRVGSLGLAGLTLPQLLAAKASASSLDKYVHDRSVVLLFLQGGPSHIETFDPKMSAPLGIRAIFGETPTTHAGITFGSHFPRLAAMADKFSIVRSFGSKNGGHTYESVTVAGNPLKAAMSSIYARVVGTNNPQSGIPTNCLVLPEAVQEGVKLKSNFETSALPTLTQPGVLGPNYAAFNPAGGSTMQQNMQLRLSPERFSDRRLLLGQLDRARRAADATLGAADKYQQQAFDMITRGVAEAFDLSKEDPRTIEKYDTSKLFRLDDATKWFDMARASNLLGRQMLMARRLCEAGCGFVTVSDCGWDMHSNGNSPKGLGGMKWLGPQVDHAVAAFIEDVEARGLRDKILLIVTGEMGRTPRVNKDGGRDHYGELTPLLVYGGGLKMGQVVGESDRNAERPATTPYDPRNLMATIFHSLFNISELRLDPSVPRDISQIITNGQPIAELV